MGVVCAGLQVSVVGLERALLNYVKEPTDTPFDIRAVPLATQQLPDQRAGTVACCIVSCWRCILLHLELCFNYIWLGCSSKQALVFAV